VTLKIRLIPCPDVKDGPRRPQRQRREDAHNQEAAVR